MKKKCSSAVWRFFDRIENEDHRCLAVLCKLCDTQYKFFGNTTNLRTHLINKHRLQWELSQSDTFDETSFRVDDEESNQSSVTPKRRKYSKGYKDKNVDVLDTSIVDNDQNDAEDSEATFNLVRQLHETRASDEEWLEEDYSTAHVTFESKPKRKYRKIKKEVQSPPPSRRVSTYTPQTVTYDNPSPIIIEQPSQTKDEYSVFGEYVANKLRKFKAPRTRGNLQQLITTILWQAEYGAFDNAEAVKRVLLYTAHEADNKTQTDSIMKGEEANQSGDSKSLIESQE
ncbi:unnamed protein product [Chilo suppressalis]|uniref:BED-type domain-containing protein n=1 Tax=Chilo suppressalis TaxID=168631 RepID=A0ABN8L457_CHISP|nr:hypothetical protein evm_010474 [Chilo suppressalis]CAH2985852.1 unnamed protein product [Chilo suppressalis]